MSLTARVARRRASDEGFTLVEVMASMVVFAIASTAVTAMFAAGLRASLITKLDTNAKNLTQQRFEIVRNLPFHIDQVSSGTNPPDLLDTYYRNATGAGAARGTAGYVPAGATRYTADGDPATGAFYRYVESPIAGYPKFTQYVATQFIDDTGAAVTPPSTFNTQTYAADAPPAAAVGVSVTTIWTVKSMTRKLRSYTQLSAGRPSAPRAVLKSKLTALRLSGGLTGGVLATGDFAAISADGAVSTTVSAATAARAATLDLSSGGSTVQGALRSADAPADDGPWSGSLGSQTGSGGLNGSFGNTTYGNVFAGTSTGQPVIGTSASPVRADVLGSGGAARVATFSLDSSMPSRLGLGSTHAYVEDAGCGGSCSNIGVSGYASGTSSGTTHGISTNASGFVRGTLVLLPTTFAPNGLIRVTLTSVSVSCSVSRTGSATPTASASVTYSGSLSYFAPFAAGNVLGYVTVPLSSTQSTSPLTAAVLTSTKVGVDSSGTPMYLSDYFATWGSLTTSSAAAAVTIGSGSTTAAASFTGAIGITTQPLRPGDDTSALGAQLGAGSCDAEDYR